MRIHKEMGVRLFVYVVKLSHIVCYFYKLLLTNSAFTYFTEVPRDTREAVGVVVVAVVKTGLQLLPSEWQWLTA